MRTSQKPRVIPVPSQIVPSPMRHSLMRPKKDQAGVRSISPQTEVVNPYRGNSRLRSEVNPGRRMRKYGSGEDGADRYAM